MNKLTKGSIKKQAIIDCLTWYPGITAEQIQAYTCLSKRAVQYHLRELIEQQMVKKDKKPCFHSYTIRARFSLTTTNLKKEAIHGK